VRDSISFTELESLWKIDFIIVNGENAHMGKGITTPLAKKFKNAGVDCITSGNHIWDTKKKDVLIDMAGYVLRPVNYPRGNIGLGSNVFSAGSEKIGVINAQGIAFMAPIRNPFTVLEEEITAMRKEANIIFLDFHAEATAEKQAIAREFDGRVSVVAGTHTHVQTADEQILPGGTGYITDAGMTGPFDSVIGMITEHAIERFKLQTPIYYRHASGNPRINGILTDINSNGRCERIARVNMSKSEFNSMAEKKKTPFTG
jgi:metallophosphoesterase (TIGR00282 family)